MPQYRLHTEALDEDGCAAVHRATLDLLDGTGVGVQHDEALALLAAAGARVEGTRVRMPAGLIDEALAAAPRTITLSSRGAAPALELTDGPVYYGTGSDCIFVHGPGARDRRQGVLADVEDMAALQQKLTNIDYVLSMVHPHELPAQVAPVAQFAAMLRGTCKPLIMVPEDARHLEVFNEMAAACGAAGSWGDLCHADAAAAARQGVGGQADGLRPAGHPHGVRQRLPARRHGAGVGSRVRAARQRRDAERPCHHASRRSGSAVRVRHLAGLDGAALGPHRVLRARGDGGAAGIGRHGAPLRAAVVRGTGGCSDSLLLDEQWAFEMGMTLLTAAQSGVTLLHDIGYVASGTGSSYEAMVVADELVGWVKAYVAGVTIDEETLAAAEIAAAGPGGTHLGRNYSRRHLRDFFRPRLTSQDSFESLGEPQARPPCWSGRRRSPVSCSTASAPTAPATTPCASWRASSTAPPDAAPRPGPRPTSWRTRWANHGAAAGRSPSRSRWSSR